MHIKRWYKGATSSGHALCMWIPTVGDIWFTVRNYWILFHSFVERVNSHKMRLPSLQIVTLCLLIDDTNGLHQVDMHYACEYPQLVISG